MKALRKEINESFTLRCNMARKSFQDQMMEIRSADEARQTRITFEEINSGKRNSQPPTSEHPSTVEQSSSSLVTTTDNSVLKEAFKDAIREVLFENKEFLHEILVEAMEDVAMTHSIKEDKKSGTVG